MPYKLNKKFIIQKMDKETIVFDGDKSILYTLNETASYMLGKLKTGWNEEKIVTYLCKTYAIEKKRAEKDLARLVSVLKKKKILL